MSLRDSVTNKTEVLQINGTNYDIATAVSDDMASFDGNPKANCIPIIDSNLQLNGSISQLKSEILNDDVYVTLYNTGGDGTSTSIYVRNQPLQLNWLRMYGEWSYGGISGGLSCLQSGGSAMPLLTANITNNSQTIGTSPILQGTPTCITQGNTNSSTLLASTAFTQNAILRRLPKSINISKSVTITLPSSTTASTWRAGGVYKENGTTKLSTTEPYTTPSAGMAIYYINITYPSNANGRRFLHAYYNSSNIDSRFMVNAASGAATQLSVPVIGHFSSGQTLGARFFQSSGSSLSTTIYVIGVFIPD